MSFLTTDYSNLETTPSYGPLPQGEYEVVIQSASHKVTKNGKEALSLDLVVRNDLANVPALANANGKYQNRHIFFDEWKRNVNGQYQFKMDHLLMILGGAGIPEGVQVKSFEDLLDMLQGKPVKVYAKVEDNEYNGEVTKINTIAPWNITKTSYPQVNHQFNANDAIKGNNPFVSEASPIDIPENDLPF